MATSIRSRSGKLERRATPYQRMLSETEIVERLITWTQHWPDAVFEEMAALLKAGNIAEVMRRVGV